MNTKKIKDSITNAYYNIKTKAEEVGDKVIDFVVDHPQETAAIIITVTPLLIKGVRARNEWNRKNLTMYDHSLNYRHHLRRPIRNYEAIEIAERRANGERLVDILNNMKLLK